MALNVVKTAICAIVKNEQQTILQWIAYHGLIGFDSFLLIDDRSTDGTCATAARASRYYDIRLTVLEEEGAERQRRAYERVCRMHDREFHWIAFIDLDEYLAPRKGGSLADLLRRCDGFAGIALPWLMFGSSHHDAKPDGLIIEDFQRRSEFGFGPNRHVKSIVRPGLVRRAVNPHAFELDGPYCLPDGRDIDWTLPGVLELYPEDAPWMLHHYFTRSRAHWQDRMARGQLGDITRTWTDFADYDRNEVTDLTSAQHGAAVRAEIGRITAAARHAA